MVDRHDQGLTFEYDSVRPGELNAVTDAAGREVEVIWDSIIRGDTSKRRIVRVELPDGRGVDYSYGLLFAVRLVGVTDVRGNDTEYDYESNTLTGLLETITDQNGNVAVSNTFGGSGVDDGRGVVEQEDALAGERTFVYLGDGAYSVARVTQADGSVNEDAYSANVLVKQTDDNDVASVYTYDEMGSRTSVTDGKGLRTDMAYDDRGNLLEVFNEIEGLLETRTYDADDNLLTITDGRAQTTTYTYDDGDLVAFENPDGGETTYTYNPDGTVASVTDPRGKTTTYDYDADGNRTLVTGPLGGELARILRRGGLSSADEAVARSRHDAYRDFARDHDLDAMMRARGLR